MRDDDDDEVLKFGAATVDSGCGTPESMQQALVESNQMDPQDSDTTLCGLHNLQSIFCLPIQHYIGNGGLDKRNAVQVIDSIFDMFKAVYQQVGPNQAIREELLKTIQEPLITHWWTLG
jgi:hypothetical protein